MREIRQNFLSVLKTLEATQNIVMIDANRGLEDVEKEILNYV